MPRPLTLDDLAVVNGQHIGQCPPPQAQEEIAQADPPSTVDAFAAQAGRDYCQRVLAVGDLLDRLGGELRDDKGNIDPETVRSLVESIIQTGKWVSTGSSVSGRMKEVIQAALTTIDLGTVMQSWRTAVEQFCPLKIERLLNQLAARHVLQCLADYVVAWADSESITKGKSTSFGLSFTGGLGI